MRSPLLWLALALHVVLAGSYAWATPDFEAPDENSHYEYAWHLGNAGDLPLTPGLAAARGLPQTEGCVLAHHPPLYYALVGLAMRAAGRDDTVFGPRINPAFGNPAAPSRDHKFLHERRPDRLLFGLRLLSVLLGAVTIVLTHRLARACCPASPRTADLATLLAATLPMWSSLHGALNSDALATCLSTAALLQLVQLLRSERPAAPRAAATGLLLGLAWITKTTTLFLGGLAVLVLAALCWRARRTGDLPRVLGLGALTAALALAVSGPVFWRNAALYGDPLAMHAHDQLFTQPEQWAAMLGRPWSELRWYYLFGVDLPLPDGNRLPVPNPFVPTVFTSLFGRFGWFVVPPHPVLVVCGAATAALALLGLVRAAFDASRAALPRPLWLLLATLLLVLAGTTWFNLSAPQPQGRLLFPAIAPAATLLAAGLLRISERLPGRRWLALLLPATAFAVFFGTFRPALDPSLAPAPPDLRTLVGGIVAEVAEPAIAWRTGPPAAALDAPPTLRWSDPTAPDGTRYTLYAFDERGRVWLATHEWTAGQTALTGGEWTFLDAVWQFLPRGVPVRLRLRRVPTDPDVDPATLPASATLTLTRS
ncbi:MAG: DUF2142 domain-containing protein [Planctomycetes bacterium]|nr:DUF2142 domain-containing protein [Planctomycetota bacterium]